MSTESHLSPMKLHQRWGFHPESIRRMIRQGRLPAMRIGKRLLIAEADILAFEAAQHVRGPVQGGPSHG
jgi:excisionase family DNA binding protein